jgi:enoyl-CoA hydratase/carnithine racemase
MGGIRMKEYQEIKCDLSENILTITMNRPERYNTYTQTLGNEMIDAFQAANRNDQVRVVIVTGAQAGKNFCAGMDLADAGNTFNSTAVPLMEHRDSGGVLALAIYDCNKPVIAAMNGSAVGVGFTMTLPMDFRIASNKAKMGAVFVRRGVVPDGCSSFFLPRLVGMSNAMRIAMTGNVMTAQEMYEMGLLYQIVEPDQVMTAARALARDIAVNCAPVSCAIVRRMFWTMQGASSPMDAHEIESQLYWYLGNSPDAAEGVNSFLEKRSPRYAMSPTKDLPPCYPWWSERTFHNK